MVGNAETLGWTLGINEIDGIELLVGVGDLELIEKPLLLLVIPLLFPRLDGSVGIIEIDGALLVVGVGDAELLGKPLPLLVIPLPIPVVGDLFPFLLLVGAGVGVGNAETLGCELGDEEGFHVGNVDVLGCMLGIIVMDGIVLVVGVRDFLLLVPFPIPWPLLVLPLPIPFLLFAVGNGVVVGKTEILGNKVGGNDGVGRGLAVGTDIPFPFLSLFVLPLPFLLFLVGAGVNVGNDDMLGEGDKEIVVGVGLSAGLCLTFPIFMLEPFPFLLF